MFAPSSFSSASAADIVNLVDDDCPPAELSVTAAPSRYSALSDPPTAPSDDDPFHITASSQHAFPTYQLMRDFLEQYAAQCGFEVRYPANKGTADQTGHSGTARCWCYLDPPAMLKHEEQQQPSHPPQRTIIPRMANRSGNQVKCGCPWRINFSRRASGEYVFTATRYLQHSGHDCIVPSRLAVMIDSLRVVPNIVQEDVRTALVSGVHGVESLRRFLASKHQLELSRGTFSDLVQRTKSELGIKDGQADFSALITWLQQEMRGGTAIARINIDGDATVCGIFYMSAEMVHHSQRNSQVLMMDTTFSTNRFSWPLLFLCAVDQHNHTVLLGVALLRHQTTDAFEWVLQQLQSVLPEDTWESVACVFTDGDQAMAAALASTMPHSQHLRCRYHLKQNLRAKLHKAGIDSIAIEQCVGEWEAAAHCETEQDFNTAIAALVSNHPSVRQYMAGTFPAGRYYADFALNHITTLGVRTTARVESWNAVLKGMLEVDSRTSLTVLFETLRYALCDKDHRSSKKALDMATRRPATTQARTIDAETAPHLTYYAQCVVKTQASLVANYRFDMIQAANPAIFNVFDRRPVGHEQVRQVTITETTMQCSCGFPTAYLLPCRHVLVVNNHIYNTQFRASQVGRRWLRAHMPAVRELSAPHSFLYQPPLDIAVPSLSSAVSAAIANLPARKARYGQIMGWCSTIATIAAEHGQAFGYIARKVEALCKEVEQLASEPAAERGEQPASAASGSSTVAPVRPELHPSVGVEQMQMGPHRKRSRGRANEKRQQSAVELASKGMRVHAPLTASQTM